MVTGRCYEAGELGQSTPLERRMFTAQHHKDARACWVDPGQMQHPLEDPSLSMYVRDFLHSGG